MSSLKILKDIAVVKMILLKTLNEEQLSGDKKIRGNLLFFYNGCDL